MVPLCIFSTLCMCRGDSQKPKFTYCRHQRPASTMDAQCRGAVFPAANAGLKCTLSEVKEGEEQKILPEHASTDAAHINTMSVWILNNMLATWHVSGHACNHHTVGLTHATLCGACQTWRRCLAWSCKHSVDVGTKHH